MAVESGLVDHMHVATPRREGILGARIFKNVKTIMTLPNFIHFIWDLFDIDTGIHGMRCTDVIAGPPLKDSKKRSSQKKCKPECLTHR